jgi:REP-associated tyrosine transposase
MNAKFWAGGPFKPDFGLSGDVHISQTQSRLTSYILFMPWGLTRFHESGQSHFVTFCCDHRRRLLTTDAARRTFESALERARRSYRLHVYGYVIMPEHVHLLLSEPQLDTLADALKSLKQGVSRRLIGKAGHFWQKRYYDFNVRNYPQFVEKLYSSQSGEAGVVWTSTRLGVEQFSPLRNRL